MQLSRLFRIGLAAAVAAVVTAEAWSLAESYRDARACLDALPALEENGELVVDSLRRPNDLRDVVDIGYRAVDVAGARPGRLRCAFGDGLDGGRRLLGAEFKGVPVGDARLYFLQRFWLEDPAAVESGGGRLRVEVPPVTFLAAVVGQPRPSLIGVLLCALLAIAMLAANRFSASARRP